MSHRLIYRSEPTHIMTITVPLNMDGAADLDYDPIEHAMREILALSALAADRVVCGDLNVSIKAAT